VIEKVLVIGLDGATWDILRPLAERGVMPRIKWLMERSAWGDLLSTYPPSTVPAWVSFQTGTDVIKHQRFYFTQPVSSLDDFRVRITSKDIEGITFYEILDKRGKKTILINLPVSYPPRSNGITITCFLTPGRNIVFPPNLVEEILDLKEYQLLPDVSLRNEGKVEEYIKDIRKVEKIRFRCARRLFTEREWDFFFIMFSGTDWIQHVKFEDIVSMKIDKQSETLKAYKDIDSYIGWFVENLPPDTAIFLLSDHGFKKYPKIFNMNVWLAQHSYLRYSVGERDTTWLRQEGRKLVREDEKSLAQSKFPIENAVRATLVSFWNHTLSISSRKPVLTSLFKKSLSFLARSRARIPRFGKLNFNFDPSNSIARGGRWGSIYINGKQEFEEGIVEQIDLVCEDIANELKEVRDFENGEKVFERVICRGRDYVKSSDNLPDIICESENYWISDNLSLNRIIENLEYVWHSRKAILLVYGPSIKECHNIRNARIYDVAPTVLHIFGFASPKNMDGRVLREIFEESHCLEDK